MGNTTTVADWFLKELEAETTASRKCLERIPESLFDYKPHEKSMNLGYLALMVAEIPKWLKLIIEDSEIDFAAYEHFQPKTNAELVAHFDENLANAKKALQAASDEDFNAPFDLKNKGEVLYSSVKKDEISSAINHLVHHRGQLTVYMRLNDIAVPSIYGPSADDRSF
ncbi:MAG TPA: DinB family protein [Pyrinomonadaceae bacterium]|jgi:uncharacterized damage-inducible protein DinB|nr:DinB family protein [Pyrinomonadaceae bacterium]